MVTKVDDIHAQLNALKEAYAAKLPVKFDEIGKVWSDIADDNGSLKENIILLHRLVHSIAGSGATFGYNTLSQQARTIEQIVNSWLTEGAQHINNDREKVSGLLTLFRETTFTPDKEEAVISAVSSESQAKQQKKSLIYMLEDDAVLAKKLSAQLTRYNYIVETFAYAGELKAAIKSTQPALLIADITLPEGRTVGLDIVREIRSDIAPDLSVIFTSARDDFDIRLQAVRAGGETYFVKPLNIDQLIDRLDQMTCREKPDPYRILVIDDDTSLAEHYALILRQAGMEVSVTSNPENIFHDIARCNPEFILMDMHMPECSGMELAKLIRQQDAYISIPIVFLSTESNINKQLSALGLGGDDFLNKPIQNNHLVLSVTARVQRARQLSNLMSQDSLTGLLKHTSIKQQLEAELSRAKRLNSTLCYVMIDIDHFKKVNDTYGHMTGDRVIKSLARMLQHRLRKTDSIGRYGGEEFALVLPDTDIKNAKRIVEEIQRRFSELKFQFNKQEFNVTLSAGIACYPVLDKGSEINQAADKALYQAKKKGRNRTELDRKSKSS